MESTTYKAIGRNVVVKLEPRLQTTGIFDTDKMNGDYYESIGIVVSAGEKCESVKVGDRVHYFTASFPYVENVADNSIKTGPEESIYFVEKLSAEDQELRNKVA